MNNIKNDIKNGTFKRVYLLFGEEDYLKRLYLDKLKSALVTPGDTMNYTYLSGDGFDANELIDISETLPMFADHRLIVVDRCGLFARASKDNQDSEKKSGNDGLSAYLAKVPESTVIVFVEDNVDKRNKMYNAVKKNGYPCEMAYLKANDLAIWIASELKKNGKVIKASTANYLVEYSGTDMVTLSLELEKLVFYTGQREEITVSDIEAICTRHITAVIFNLTDAIAEGNRKKALDIYNDLKAQREPLQMIFYMLLRHYMQLYCVKQMRSEGKSPADIASAIGVQDFVVRRLTGQGERYSLSSIRKKLDYGVSLEYDSKSGRISDDKIVELFIFC